MKKTPTTGGKTSVTFDLPPIEAESVAVCGDFNDWSPDSHPLKRRKDGSFATTVRLGPGRYHFRYLIDGQHWENDWSADAYAPNDHGSDDSVAVIEDVATEAEAPEPKPKKRPSAAGAKSAKAPAATAKPTKHTDKKSPKATKKASPTARKAPKA